MPARFFLFFFCRILRCAVCRAVIASRSRLQRVSGTSSQPTRFWLMILQCVPRYRCPNRAQPRSPHLPVTWRSGAKRKQGLVSCWCNGITASSRFSLWSHWMSLILSWVTPVPNPGNFARHSPETRWITQVLEACSDILCEAEQRETILNSKFLFEVRQRGRRTKKKQKGMKEKEEKSWCLSRLQWKVSSFRFIPLCFLPPSLSAQHTHQ